jgi:hypothetical protein
VPATEHSRGDVKDPSGLDLSHHDGGQLAWGKTLAVKFEQIVTGEPLDAVDAALRMPAVGMIRAI